MCIIVDANKLGAFLADPADEDSSPIRRWLDRGAGRFRAAGSRIRGRRAKRPMEGEARGRFAADERSLKARADLRSDDPHLALARTAGVRLLYTGDRRFQGQEFHRQGQADATLLTGSVCASPRPDPGR